MIPGNASERTAGGVARLAEGGWHGGVVRVRDGTQAGCANAYEVVYLEAHKLLKITVPQIIPVQNRFSVVWHSYLKERVCSAHVLQNRKKKVGQYDIT